MGHVGGLLGYNKECALSNCSWSGTVYANGGYGGGLVGTNRQSNITSCTSSGDVSGDNMLGGLVGYNRESDLTNCTSSGSVSGVGETVGGLVGSNYYSEIINCTSIGSVLGDNYVGGLVGYNYGADAGMFNCTSPSDVTGRTNVGGLVGQNRDGTLIHCSATGIVTSTGGSAGGFIGINYGTISDCFATGAVSANGGGAGGLAVANYGTVRDCFATGNVTGSEHVGALVGYAGGDSTTTRSYATGNVIGDEAVGGLVGEIQGPVTDCYATGSVSGTTNVGGLAGYIHDNYAVRGRIFRCYSTGQVSGSTYVGGIVGTNSGTVGNCFWDKQTSGRDNMCGRQVGIGNGCDNTKGKTTTEMQTLSTFTSAGWDFTDETANGTEDIWRLCVDGTSYPMLAWQIALLGDFFCPDGGDALDLAFLLERWLADDCNGLNGYCDGADLDRGGEVDGKDYGLFAGNWSAELMVLMLDEDFETGDFSKYDWQHSGDANWVVVSDIKYEGSYSARSGS
ncbi:MAG: GLUG motif-containing protein, partial [Planctomycetota bacterium]